MTKEDGLFFYFEGEARMLCKRLSHEWLSRWRMTSGNRKMTRRGHTSLSFWWHKEWWIHCRSHTSTKMMSLCCQGISRFFVMLHHASASESNDGETIELYVWVRPTSGYFRSKEFCRQRLWMNEAMFCPESQLQTMAQVHDGLQFGDQKYWKYWSVHLSERDTCPVCSSLENIAVLFDVFLQRDQKESRIYIRKRSQFGCNWRSCFSTRMTLLHRQESNAFKKKKEETMSGSSSSNNEFDDSNTTIDKDHIKKMPFVSMSLFRFFLSKQQMKQETRDEKGQQQISIV